MKPRSKSLYFWGTRGFVSSPRLQTCKYGGNTSCTQIVDQDKLLLVDTGFGATNLGETLLGQENLDIHILYTTFHWDHIQGLPFFHPIYFPSNKITLYAPLPPEETHKYLDILFDGSFSPFEGLNQMPANISIKQLEPETEVLGNRVSFAPSHSAGDAPAFSYALTTSQNEKISFVSNHEASPGPKNDRIVSLVEGSDILVHAGQYSDRQYPSRRGWGQASIRQALDNGVASAAQSLLITHHDPAHDDSHLDELFRRYRAESKYAVLDFGFAEEKRPYDLIPQHQKEAKNGRK